MLKNDGIAAPGMVDQPGLAERVGRKVIGAAEAGRLSYATEKAARQERMRPILNEAIEHAREAERDVTHAQTEYAWACAALVMGDGDEAEVEACERELSDAERDVRRYTAAAREIESRLGIIRDPFGHIQVTACVKNVASLTFRKLVPEK